MKIIIIIIKIIAHLLDYTVHKGEWRTIQFSPEQVRNHGNPPTDEQQEIHIIIGNAERVANKVVGP